MPEVFLREEVVDVGLGSASEAGRVEPSGQAPRVVGRRIACRLNLLSPFVRLVCLRKRRTGTHVGHPPISRAKWTVLYTPKWLVGGPIGGRAAASEPEDVVEDRRLDKGVGRIVRRYVEHPVPVLPLKEGSFQPYPGENQEVLKR